jgi:hypothetical protein
VVVDSLAAATARGETSLEAARAILGFLGTIARKGHLALVVIHHLRKGAGAGRGANAVRVAAEDLRGSSHISAAARSVMALSVVGCLPGREGLPGTLPPAAHQPASAGVSSFGAESDEVQPEQARRPAGSRFDGPRCLEIVKTNLCRHPPPLGLIFEGEDVPVPTLRYTEYVEPAPEPTLTDLCADWLLGFLAAAGEPVKPIEAIQAAQEAGYTRTTLYRARSRLGNRVVDVGRGPYDPYKRWGVGESVETLER